MLKEHILFLDETGLLNIERDKYFGLGVLKTPNPQTLYVPIKKIRDKHGFYDEVKWSSISNKNISLVKEIISLFVSDENSTFNCLFLDKHKLDFEQYFNNNFWKVYESFTFHLLKASIKPSDSCVLLADMYPASPDTDFELAVKSRINKKFNRVAVHSVCRLDSKSTDLLQLCDYFLGAVSYEYKLANNLIPNPSKLKTEMLDFIKELLAVPTFVGNVKGEKINCMFFEGSKNKFNG